jgi:hypothetical protein
MYAILLHHTVHIYKTKHMRDMKLEVEAKGFVSL